MRKEKTLSSKWYKVYKGFLLLLITGLVVFYLVASIMGDNSWFSAIVVVLYIFLLIRYWMPSFFKMLRNFEMISYDRERLFIKRSGGDIEVPFERVKEVELISLDGIYKFSFYQKDELGEAVYCKPSMWYPFNFPKVDRELENIRYLIKKRKEKVWDSPEESSMIASQTVTD